MNVAKKTVTSMRLENMLIRSGIGASLLLNLVLGYTLATKPATVVLIPPFTYETMEFIDGKANRSYYEQWAWSTSMMFGNLSPGNVEFVRGEFERLATPALYGKMQDQLQSAMDDINTDKASVTFTPNSVAYDPSLDLFFVTGTQVLSGPGSRDGKVKQMTYELGFISDRLRVKLNSFNVYEGKPLTSDIRQEEIERRKAEGKS